MSETRPRNPTRWVFGSGNINALGITIQILNALKFRLGDLQRVGNSGPKPQRVGTWWHVGGKPEDSVIPQRNVERVEVSAGMSNAASTRTIMHYGAELGNPLGTSRPTGRPGIQRVGNPTRWMLNAFPTRWIPNALDSERVGNAFDFERVSIVLDSQRVSNALDSQRVSNALGIQRVGNPTRWKRVGNSTLGDSNALGIQRVGIPTRWIPHAIPTRWIPHALGTRWERRRERRRGGDVSRTRLERVRKLTRWRHARESEEEGGDGGGGGGGGGGGDGDGDGDGEESETEKEEEKGQGGPADSNVFSFSTRC
eukprot:gene17870-biopygen7699